MECDDADLRRGAGGGARRRIRAREAAAMMPEWCQTALSARAQLPAGERTQGEEHDRLRRSGAVIARDPARFGARFYERLFERAPELRPLFPAELQAQHAKLSHMLSYLLAALDRPEELSASLQALGRRHRGYGATFVHYLAVGEALVGTLAEFEGAAFDEATRLAWARLVSWVIYRMRHVEPAAAPAAVPCQGTPALARGA